MNPIDILRYGQRDIDDDRLSNLIEEISAKRLGLLDVEPDIIGRSYEYLIRKFAEGSGQSAGEFFTPFPRRSQSI
jgi:type I restriction enzyme M protein